MVVQRETIEAFAVFSYYRSQAQCSYLITVAVCNLNYIASEHPTAIIIVKACIYPGKYMTTSIATSLAVVSEEVLHNIGVMIFRKLIFLVPDV